MEFAVVGAGAAGLAAGRYLSSLGRRFIILESGYRIGDSWRHRYSGLRLFTPARFCALPDLPMPMPDSDYPDKDQVADYLERYARRCDFPIRLNAAVREHHLTGAGAHRLTGDNFSISADRVIVATGAHGAPNIPSFADELGGHVRQVHSGQYHDEADLKSGPVLVVGAGPSGADISASLALDRDVWLAGPATGQLPLALMSSPAFRRLVYQRRIPSGALGKRVRRAFGAHGAPLVRQSEATLRVAGVGRAPEMVGVRDGKPLLADGRVLDVANVIWCTGFRPDFGWLDGRAVGPDGWPRQRRGVSDALPGLGFVGLPRQNTVGSGYLSGMAGDARYVVKRLGR
ncbi:NAD(P)-binding domain-containing protein [Actinoplanes sp. TBRC 11911]|uniref:flavin-containing monooxygenase n=1 Tax=Actinoplanes sp. TBRC 11911 TaxID=2729386 RepID=UPI00145CF281|nr:NAD(P)-binding domain-containing protein [Actinoplanes sp. TBRC 11911]NMO49662.1 NAD(P)-binding domain-containing protein [Actinoplanes sp. TBRC 11911]